MAISINKDHFKLCPRIKCIAFNRIKKTQGQLRSSKTQGSNQASKKQNGDLLAEVEKQPFKHQNGASAAEDDERLTTQQTENATSDGRAQKTLQHTLHTCWKAVRETLRA